MKRLPYIFVPILVLLSAPLHAISCGDLFSNAMGASDRLQMEDNARLLNTGDRIMQTDELRLSGSPTCDARTCLASGSAAPLIEFTRPSTSSDLTGSRTFSAGEYEFDDVLLGSGDVISISGGGQVIIRVRDDLTIDDYARVNTGGDATRLVFMVYDDARVRGHSRVNATIYSRDKMEITEYAEMQGAVVGKRSKIADRAQITYDGPEENAIGSYCEGGSTPPLPDPEPLSFRIEVGALTVIDTYAKPDFTRVNFTQTFDEPPVVFTLPTTQGGNSAAHRIRNVTVEGFDIMTLEPLGEDGPHIAMALNYLAVEKGVHDLPGGRKLRVDTISTRRNQAYRNTGSNIGWETVSFGDSFSKAPAVLGQVQTMVNEQESQVPRKPSKPWLTTAISEVTNRSMKLALERSESTPGSVTGDEVIGFLAIEPVDKMVFLDSADNEIILEAIRSEPLVKGWGTCNKTDTRIAFSRTWDEIPIALASKNTRDGDSGSGEGDGGWLRRCTTSKSYVSLTVDEVRSNKLGDRNRNHNTRERAGVLLISDNFVTEARQLDHYRIEHDGSGVAGIPETVTIRVCKDSACSALYTGTVTVTLSPGNATTSWSGDGVQANQVTFDGGSKTVSLKHKAGGTITLGLDSTPKANDSLRCYVGASQTCKITFAATDFRVDIPDKVSAGTASGSVSLDGCFDAVRSVKVTASAVASYLDPAGSGPAVTVNGSKLPSDGRAGSVELVFDENCRAPLNVRYDEAGRVGVAVSYTGSGEWEGVTISGSDNAVFYPAALQVVASASGTLLNNTGASGQPVHSAALGFDLAISAVNSAGAVTTRYQPQAADRLLGYLRRSGPTGGASVDGSLQISAVTSLASSTAVPGSLADFSSLAIAPADVTNGSYSYPAAAYNEVGLVTLDVADSDYFGYQIDADETPIGRFVPASFTRSASLTNRSATVGCSGGSFSYLGETLSASVDLTAQSATGTVTRNYLGSFAKFNGGGLSPYAGATGYTLAATHAGADRSGRLQVFASSASSWSGGGSTLSIDLAMNRAGSPDGPFDNTMIGLSVIDSDGVALDSLDMDVDSNGADEHALLGTTNLRYGRVALGNAHGSDLRDLAMPVFAQYYAGAATGFITHGDDNCSPLASASLGDVDTSDALDVGETCIRDSAGSSGGFACADAGNPADQYTTAPTGGVYRLVLAAPGAGNTGSLNVSVDAPDYLHYDWSGAGADDPQSLATFGIYSRDTSIIYQRELR